MTSEVVLLISILCLIKCTWCGNYGFALGQRHSNDEILHEELLTNNDDSNETIIEYVYIAEKPVSYMQLRTDTNIYTEVTFFNSNKIYIKLSNFEPMEFNATLTVYGFPWHPDGPEPDDDIQFLLQPNPGKAIYLNKSSVEESGIIATNGAYMSEEISKTKEDSDVADENEDDEDRDIDSDSDSNTESDSTEYYDYDYTSVLEEDTAEDGEPESIVDVKTDSEVVSQSVGIKVNYLFYIIISVVLVVVL